jgi:hypothetical protein
MLWRCTLRHPNDLFDLYFLDPRPCLADHALDIFMDAQVAPHLSSIFHLYRVPAGEVRGAVHRVPLRSR